MGTSEDSKQDDHWYVSTLQASSQLETVKSEDLKGGSRPKRKANGTEMVASHDPDVAPMDTADDQLDDDAIVVDSEGLAKRIEGTILDEDKDVGEGDNSRESEGDSVASNPPPELLVPEPKVTLKTWCVKSQQQGCSNCRPCSTEAISNSIT